MDNTDTLSQLFAGLGIDVKTALTLAPWAFGATDYLKRYLGKSEGAVKVTAAFVSLLLGELYTLAALGARPLTGSALAHGLLLGLATAAFAVALAKGRQRIPDNRPTATTIETETTHDNA